MVGSLFESGTLNDKLDLDIFVLQAQQMLQNFFSYGKFYTLKNTVIFEPVVIEIFFYIVFIVFC